MKTTLIFTFAISLSLIFFIIGMETQKKISKLNLEKVNKKYKTYKALRLQLKLNYDRILNIRSMLEAPSKSALHSKYKNDLILEIKELNQNNLTYLQKMVDLGFDDMIKTDTGDKMLISEYLLLQKPKEEKEISTKVSKKTSHLKLIK